MYVALFLLGLVGGSASEGCGSPPSRASDSYWNYIEACGCDQVDAPSRASADYDRYLKACAQWRERNQVKVVVSPSPTTAPTPAASPSPAPSPKPTPSAKPAATPKPAPPPASKPSGGER